MAQITDDDLDTLKHCLLGTCMTLDAALMQLEIECEVAVAEDRLLDGSMAVELCSDCGWWFESISLEAADNGTFCEDCRPDLHE